MEPLKAGKWDSLKLVVPIEEEVVWQDSGEYHLLSLNIVILMVHGIYLISGTDIVSHTMSRSPVLEPCHLPTCLCSPGSCCLLMCLPVVAPVHGVQNWILIF